MINHIYHLWNY